MDLRAIILGVTFAFIWASAFTSARVIVDYAPPISALAVRFWISGVIGVALARMSGQSWRLTRGQWLAVIVFGICQNAIYLGANFVAMQTIEASLATIIAATMPLLVALIGWLAFGTRFNRLGALGLVVGLAGVTLIMGARFSGGVDGTGVALCVIGVVALAVATLAVRGASTGGNLLMVVGLQMLVAAAILSPVALLTEEPTIEPTWQLWLSFAYTVVFPGLLATWIWFVLVQRIGAVKAATYHFLTPVFGVGVAAILLGEALGWADLVGVAIVALGILAVQLSRQGAAVVGGTVRTVSSD